MQFNLTVTVIVVIYLLVMLFIGCRAAAAAKLTENGIKPKKNLGNLLIIL